MPATDDYKYNIKKMHVIFLASAIAFTASTLLMLHKDHDDEWHEYQRIGGVLNAAGMDQERVRAYEVRQEELAVELIRSALVSETYAERLEERDSESDPPEPLRDTIESQFSVRGDQSLSVTLRRHVRDVLDADNLERSKKEGSDETWTRQEELLPGLIAAIATDQASPDVLEKVNGQISKIGISSTGSTGAYQARKAELEVEITQLSDELRSQNEDYKRLRSEADELERVFDLKGREVRSVRAFRDVARANYDLGVRDNVPADSQAALKDEFEALQGRVTTLEKEWEVLETTRDAKLVELAVVTKARDAVDADLISHTAEVARITDALDQIAPEGLLKWAKRLAMTMPIIDGFNSHQKPVQDWLPDLMITLGMTSTARFDRCRTCHVGIEKFATGNLPSFPHGAPESDEPLDWVKEGKYPHPYSSHPRPDVYLTATSPHPLNDFGCTICHDGTGSATSFHNAQHGPNDPVQSAEWHEEYGYSHNHFWEYPMLPERLRELACLKCHHDVVELGVNPKFGPTAPAVFNGWELIRKYGCFGCHEVNGFDGQDRIGPDLRLEPTAEEQPKYDTDPNLIAGQMRKVGPSLKHIGQKVSENFVSYWTEEPKRFRPTTRMPQFFGLTNLEDHYGTELSKVELAGIAQFLIKQSLDVQLDSPDPAYVADAARGKTLFAERGCLACHSYRDAKTDPYKDAVADFGPNLIKTQEKLLPGKDGLDWLYTWVRDPQRHHPRSRMPNLFLEPYDSGGGNIVDPAADIAAFLAGDGPKEFAGVEYDSDKVKGLAELHLAGKALTERQFNIFWGDTAEMVQELEARIADLQLQLTSATEGSDDATDIQRQLDAAAGEQEEIRNGLWKYPYPKDQIKGDEIELVFEDGRPTKEQFDELVMTYLGRRSVSRYGCYGCHDIHGFGESRPIGTTLQDWGRKDPSRLAPEHIHEFLHHHGERDGSSTQHFVEDALAEAKAGVLDPADREEAMRTAFFYDSLIHHGRPGFIFQKLRDPRSYDFKKTETKTYIERLVMPKFPIDDEQIEDIATFVLGLVAEPPAAKYVYTPDQRADDRNQGEILLRKYNCIACHMTDMHTLEFAVDEGDDRVEPSDIDPKFHQMGLDTLLAMRPPVPAFTGRNHTVEAEDDDGNMVRKTLPTVKFRGMVMMTPDNSPFYDEEDPDTWEYTFMSWESNDLTRPGSEQAGGVKLPNSQLNVLVSELANTGHTAAQTGSYAEWLVNRKMDGEFDTSKFVDGWNAAPPPLFHEGDKVRTDWLFRFLKDPEQIRHTLKGLRMPRFNMSDDEARILANYFAAADGSPYPYEAVPQAEPGYLNEAQALFQARHPQRAAEAENDYLQESWKMLTATVCIGCHAVGGREFVAKPGDKNVTHAPDLERVSQRLRPDWLTVWISNPAWITPYTKMPLNFPADQDPSKSYHLFDGSTKEQTLGVRDALLNYYHLLERNVQPLEPIPSPAVAVPQANAN